jgi:L-asparaginase II
MKRNEFWLSALQAIVRGERTSDRLINAEKYYKNFSAGDVKKAAILLQKANGKLIAVQMPE